MVIRLPSAPALPLSPLLSLQVLRAVAALLVLLHHAAYDADTIARRAGALPFDIERLFDGAFGIHLFFVISGYIMLRTSTGFGSWRGASVFMARRIVRLVPLYWILTSAVLAGGLVAPRLLNTPLGGSGFVAASYLFIPFARPDGDWHPVLGQGWTLDYEMFFYLLFAAAMVLSRRAGLAALISALIALPILGWVSAPGTPALTVWTDNLLLEFLFGIAIGLSQEAGWRLPAGVSHVAGVAGVAAAVALGPLFGLDRALAPCIAGGAPAAVIVAAGVLGPAWRRNRASLALALIGDASYSLYLSHPFVIRLLREGWIAGVPPGVPLVTYIGVACCCAVALALLLYRGVERPLTRALQDKSRLVGAVSRPILPDSAAATPTRRN